MLQPNRTAGFEVTARALFRAFCDASLKQDKQHRQKNIVDLKSNLRHFMTFFQF